MKKVLYVALTILVVVTLAACSGGTGDSAGNEATQAAQATQQAGQAQGTPIEPTQLITKAEAAEIMGVAVKDPEIREQNIVGQKMCLYNTVDDFLQVALIQPSTVPDGGLSPQGHFEATVGAFEDAQKVDGIGDEAYFATPGLHILSDGCYITIATGNSDDAAVRARLQEAGKTAVANLEKCLAQ